MSRLTVLLSVSRPFNARRFFLQCCPRFEARCLQNKRQGRLRKSCHRRGRQLLARARNARRRLTQPLLGPRLLRHAHVHTSHPTNVEAQWCCEIPPNPLPTIEHLTPLTKECISETDFEGLNTGESAARGAEVNV